MLHERRIWQSLLQHLVRNNLLPAKYIGHLIGGCPGFR
jgi:hypothetical protein